MSLTEQLVCSAKSFPSFRASCLRKRCRKKTSLQLREKLHEHAAPGRASQHRICEGLENISNKHFLRVLYLVFKGMEKGRLCRTACLKRGLLLWIIRWRLTDWAPALSPNTVTWQASEHKGIKNWFLRGDHAKLNIIICAKPEMVAELCLQGTLCHALFAHLHIFIHSKRANYKWCLKKQDPCPALVFVILVQLNLGFDPIHPAFRFRAELADISL